MGQRDEKAIEQAGGERGLAQRSDDDCEIQVRGQDPFTMSEQRVGAREPAAAREDLGDHQLTTRAASDPQAIAHREVALLDERQGLRQVTEQDLATHLDFALAAGDRDHQRLAGKDRIGRLRRRAGSRLHRHGGAQAFGAAIDALRAALSALLAQRKIVVVALVHDPRGAARQSCTPVTPDLRA